MTPHEKLLSEARAAELVAITSRKNIAATLRAINRELTRRVIAPRVACKMLEFKPRKGKL